MEEGPAVDYISWVFFNKIRLLEFEKTINMRQPVSIWSSALSNHCI